MKTIEKTTEERLKEKLDVLKKNLDAVGRDTLRTKYAKAYIKLLAEINELSNQIIHKSILYLDLASVKEESLPEFASILNRRHEDIKRHLLDGDFEGYQNLITEIAIVYASFWCDNVIKAHVPGQDYIFNPFTLEKIKDVSTETKELIA